MRSAKLNIATENFIVSSFRDEPFIKDTRADLHPSRGRFFLFKGGTNPRKDSLYEAPERKEDPINQGNDEEKDKQNQNGNAKNGPTYDSDKEKAINKKASDATGCRLLVEIIVHGLI
jgi:hypothetical protein